MILWLTNQIPFHLLYELYFLNILYLTCTHSSQWVHPQLKVNNNCKQNLVWCSDDQINRCCDVSGIVPASGVTDVLNFSQNFVWCSWHELLRCRVLDGDKIQFISMVKKIFKSLQRFGKRRAGKAGYQASIICWK